MTVVRFQDLPLADRGRKWNGSAANKRVRKWAGAQDGPNDQYRKAFVWYDSSAKDQFTAYKLQIADVVGGELKAIPRAVIAAGGIMQGARGGIDLPQKEIGRVKSHLTRYYEKMDDIPPWEQ